MPQKDNIYQVCQSCAGIGKIPWYNPATHQTEMIDDPSCNGTGRLIWGEIIKE